MSLNPIQTPRTCSICKRTIEEMEPRKQTPWAGEICEDCYSNPRKAAPCPICKTHNGRGIALYWVPTQRLLEHLLEDHNLTRNEAERLADHRRRRTL